MTVENPNTLRRTLAPAMAAAALALSGCAATHIGEDWQCPLAQGARCVSVASADPAVRDADAAVPGAEPVAQPPVARRADTQTSASAPGTTIEVTEPKAARDCPAFCRPFQWFARLLEADGGRDPSDASAPAGDAPEPAANDPATGARASREPRPDAANPDADVRLPETIGRVWIAPYVDADGVYREASWVRVVIAPAAWRAH